MSAPTFYAASDGSGTTRTHVVAGVDGSIPDGRVALVSLCGKPMARTFTGPIAPTWHYFGKGRRYSHNCAACVAKHEAAT